MGDELAGRAHAGVAARAAGGRFVAGDPLRAVAALTILCLHAGLITASLRVGHLVYPLGLQPIFGAALGRLVATLQVGLYVFFVLSGYLIARPFIRAFVAGDPLPAVRPYLRNRALRIVPAFWLVFTVALLVSGTLGATPWEVGSVYLFFENFNESPLTALMGQSWTLHVELGFYLLVPLVAVGFAAALGARLSARGRLVSVISATVGVGVVSLLLRGHAPADPIWLRTVPAMLFAFTPGVLLATVEIELEARLAGRRRAWPAAPLLVALGLAVVAAYSWVPARSETLRGLVEAGGTGAIVGGVLVHQWRTGGAWRVLDNRTMQWLGARSYSIYLVHQAVIHELRSLTGVSHHPKLALLLVVVAAGGVTIAISALTYRFFELPFLRRRTRWRARAAAASA